jgi:hypothetical protein
LENSHDKSKAEEMDKESWARMHDTKDEEDGNCKDDGDGGTDGLDDSKPDGKLRVPTQVPRQPLKGRASSSMVG